MQSKSDRIQTRADEPPRTVTTTDTGPVRFLAYAAFVVLAAGLCARSLLGEVPERDVADLLVPPDAEWSASRLVTCAAQIAASAGIALGVLWVLLGRRRWRYTGLEAGAALLIGAAFLAVPIASEKRLAITAAIDAILPLIAAAALYQLAVDHPLWRRAILGVLLATVAAHCYKATAQKGWQYRQELADYQRNKADFWSRRGVRLDDPLVAIYEAGRHSPPPFGYYKNPNMLASFLLLGMAAAGAGIASYSYRSARGTADRQKSRQAEGHRQPRHEASGERHNTQDSRRAPPFPWHRVGLLALVALLLWQLVVFGSVHSLGATVGFGAGVVAAAAAWWLRERPMRLAILLVASLLVLQGGLTILGVRASTFYPVLAKHGGKARSLALRLNYWQGAASLFAEHPLTGVGPGQFRRHYNAIKPAYAAEEPLHPHNWLLAVASEWGVLGLLGQLVAVGAAGWMILRSPPSPRDSASRPVAATFLPAVLAMLVCWLMVMSDLPSWPATRGIAVPFAIGLMAIAAVSLSDLGGSAGRVVLTGGLFAFLVHGTVDMAASLPGATWPFWAAAALAMAWGHGTPETLAATAPWRRRLGTASAVLAGIAACTALTLSVRPLCSAVLMHEAQMAIASSRPDENVRLLEQAAAVDPLDPNPLASAGYMCSKLASQNPDRDLSYMRQAVRLFEAAVQRDPRGHLLWRSLAAGSMRLARKLADPGAFQGAIEAKRQELLLYPTNPLAWLELSRMTAVRLSGQPEQPVLLRLALASLNRAETLSEARPGDDPTRFTAGQLAEIHRMQEDLTARLASLAGPPSTQSAR